MPNLRDVIAFESGKLEGEAAAKVLQGLVNSGMIWQMLDCYGRDAMDAIEAGRIMLGKKGCRDAYGQYVLGRDEVEAGSKGSYGFVIERMGIEYANVVAAVE